MTNTRHPAVAGLFYPADADELESSVRQYLAAAEDDGPPPKALIVPHAGYVYSGAVAASGYARLSATQTRVVLLGPAHRYPLKGIATHSADFFETPLGRVRIDPAVRSLPGVKVVDAAHAAEHSLEVHLPFLQVVLGDFALLPLVVGRATPQQVANVLGAAWGGPETVVIVSSDLSHYHPQDVAKRLDRATADAIEKLRAEEVGPERACGSVPIGGLLHLARVKGMEAQVVDLRTSGDTAGGRGEVVGYGAFVLSEPAAASR